MKVVLKGVHPTLDGAYPVEGTLTNWELHSIKMATGLTVGHMLGVTDSQDYDSVVALAMVSLMRAGKIPKRPTPWATQQMEALWDAPIGTIDTDEDEDAAPLPSGSADGQNAESESSGASSRNGSGTPDESPSPIGAPI